MAVDQENLQPVGEQTADSQIKQDTLHRNRRSLNLGLADLRTNPLTRRFLWTSARILTAGTVLGAAISDFIFHPTPDVNASSTTSITGLVPQPDNPRSVESKDNGLPNPKYFTTNTGEPGELITENGTDAISPNIRVESNDTTILKVSGVIQTKIQGNENLFPNDTDDISTLGREYNAKFDLIYLLETYGQIGKNFNTEHPLTILFVPRSKAADYSAQHRMQVSLPTMIVNVEGVQAFHLSDDGTYLEIVTNKARYQVMLQNGIETGKVEIRQSSYKAYVSVVLNR